MKNFYNNELKSAGFRIKSGMTRSEEQGRSMVEMLGVLAVIGVLSVAGIAGYTNAMNKHRANELLNEASKRAVVVAMQRAQGSALSVSEFGDTGWSVTPVENKAQFTLTSPSVSVDVCKQIVAALGQSSMVRGIKSGTTDIAGNTSNCTDGALQLIYNDDLSTTDVATPINCPDEGEAKKGVCCQNGFQYNENSYGYDILNPEACGCPDGGEVSPSDSSVCCKNGSSYYPDHWSSDKYQGVNISACGCYYDSNIISKKIYYNGEYGCRYGCEQGYGEGYGYYQLQSEFPYWSFGQYSNADICSGKYDAS